MENNNIAMEDGEVMDTNVTDVDDLSENNSNFNNDNQNSEMSSENNDDNVENDFGVIMDYMTELMTHEDGITIPDLLKTISLQLEKNNKILYRVMKSLSYKDPMK